MFNFSKRKSQSVENQDARTVEEMRADPDLIQVFDEYGREVFIDKETWRKDMLPANLEKVWSDPDQLYGVIVQSLEDGFSLDVISAAKQLYSIDSESDRAACLLGVVHLENNNLDDAERVLSSHMEAHGEVGYLLTNLAKVYSRRGDDAKAETILWRGLEVDPNQDNGVGWWGTIHHERGGQRAYLASLEKVAAIEGSWRPQIWLARAALEEGGIEQALAYYRAILGQQNPPPVDMLMQISGDLGNNGRLAEIISLCAPLYDIKLHGLTVGNNLVKAYLDSGDAESAKKIVQQLYAEKRPDWKASLNYWDNEIELKESNYGPVTSNEKLEVTLVSMGWPVWSHKLKDYKRVMPVKTDTAPSIAFFSASCAYDRVRDSIEVHRPDSQGILSRGIPLYLAEQIQMLTDAKGTTVIPVISGEGGFVLGGVPWEDETVLSGAEKAGYDYVVNAHLDASGQMWEMKLTILDVKEKYGLKILREGINPEKPTRGVEELSLKVRAAFRQLCNVKTVSSPIRYDLPRGEGLRTYIDMAESSLALSIATCENISPDFLYGTRRTLDLLLELSLQYPEHEVYRLMFIGAMAKNKAYGSDLYAEYQSRAEKLQKEHQIRGVANELAEKTLATLFAD